MQEGDCMWSEVLEDASIQPPVWRAHLHNFMFQALLGRDITYDVQLTAGITRAASYSGWVVKKKGRWKVVVSKG